MIRSGMDGAMEREFFTPGLIFPRSGSLEILRFLNAADGATKNWETFHRCKSFETLFAERIARPLNMKNTDFGKGKVALPAGGAVSTPEDYLNFLVMIMN
ncbi:MAG: hypothetical protein ACHQKY_01475, partial [Terriglobia bacterium]